MTLTEIHNKTFELFTWKSDQENFGRFEYWRSFADHVERSEPFTGDCDNFALTCAELLMRNGYEKDQISIAVCQTETGGWHLVTLYGNLVFDNRYNSIMELESLPHYTWDKYMNMSDIGVWKKF